MTKADAVAMWKEYDLPWVIITYEMDGERDMPARCESWNNFTDMLREDGQITPEQYETWDHPKECN